MSRKHIDNLVPVPQPGLTHEHFGIPKERFDSILEFHGRDHVPVIRYPGDGLEALYSDLTSLHCEDPSLTNQDSRYDSDPNEVMRKYASTRDRSVFDQVLPRYNDFIGAPQSFQEAVQQVQAAQEAFMALPAEVRSRFDNDAGKFVKFIEDDRNIDEAVKLGIVREGFGKPSEEDLASSPSNRAREAKTASVPPKGGKFSSSSGNGDDD